MIAKISACCGCGYCCMAARCCLSLFTYDTASAVCPALIFKEGRFWCQLAEDPQIKEQLYIGAGCSSSMFNQQRDAFLRGEGEAYLRSRQTWALDSLLPSPGTSSAR